MVMRESLSRSKGCPSSQNKGKNGPLERKEYVNVSTKNGVTSSTTPVLHRTKKFQRAPPPVCYHFEDLAKTPMEEPTLIPRPLSSPSRATFSQVSESVASDTPVDTDDTVIVTRSKSGYLKKTSQQSLSTIIEHAPDVYRPSEAPPCSLPPSLSEDDVASLEAPPLDPEFPCSRSEVGSIDSHRSINAIYIKPSSQLASMQAVGEHMRSTSDVTPYGAWTRSKVFLTQSQHSLPATTYVPKGSPRSVFATLGEVERDSPHDTRPAFYKPQSGKWIEERDARVCDPHQSTTSFERSTEWIESYLARRAEADRAEEEARKRQEKEKKWDLTRMNSFTKLKRRISGKKAPGGFEPRSASLARSNTTPRLQYVYPEPESDSDSDSASERGGRENQGIASATDQVQDLYSLFPRPPSSPPPTHLLVLPPPPPPPPPTPIPFSEPGKLRRSRSKPKSPSSRPLLCKHRFHSVSGASLTRFLLRRKSLGIAEIPHHPQPQPSQQTQLPKKEIGHAPRRHSVSSRNGDLGRRASLSAGVKEKLGRRASVGVKEIVARFEKFGHEGERERGRRRDSGSVGVGAGGEDVLVPGMRWAKGMI